MTRPKFSIQTISSTPIPSVVTVFLFFVMFVILLSGESFAVFNENYQEFQDPSIRTVVQSMRATQIHYNNALLYTMNVDTPGYIEIGGYNSLDRDGVIQMIPFYRWRAGPVVETLRPLDFYIDAVGKGFFQVSLPTGLGFTRDGRFTLDSRRKLVMLAGNFPVLGERGEIFLPEGDEIAVSKTGLIFVDGAPVDRMKVVVFTEKGINQLDTVNGSIFILSGEGELNSAADYSVRQGFIEQNNIIKALIGDISSAKNTYEASAKAGKAIIKEMNSAIQLGAP